MVKDLAGNPFRILEANDSFSAPVSQNALASTTVESPPLFMLRNL